MRDVPHAGLICLLIHSAVSRQSSNAFSGMTIEETKECVEALAEEILVFFADADSYSRDWLPTKPEDDDRLEKSVFLTAFESEETDAVDKAEHGDLRALEELLLVRGYLRTSRARKLAVDRMRGIKKRGSPASKINIDTYLQVAGIQFLQRCSEFKAKKTWLDENPDVAEETLTSRIKRAKKTEIGGIFSEMLSHLGTS